jgi:hypothetical protein
LLLDEGDAVEPPPAKMLPMNMPNTRVPQAAVTSCHVRHDMRSLMLSEPGAGLL